MERVKQYAKLHIKCTGNKKEEKKIYLEFKKRMKKYLLDEDMELYRIPILAKDYPYAHELSQKYEWDWSRNEEDEDFPTMYITENEDIETDYTKKDYEQAVAFVVNFWYVVYPYENNWVRDFEETCCDKPSWKYKTAMIQKKNSILPSSKFKKKKYAQLISGYVIAEEVRDLLLEYGLAKKEDFWDVINRKGEIVCYQMMPKNVVHGFAQDNNMKLVDKCEHCGMERYWYYKEPFYMSQRTLDQLVGLNQTIERCGGYFDEEELKRDLQNGEDMRSTMEPWYIVNKEVYNLLHKHYPRMQFIPIFLKEEKE